MTLARRIAEIFMVVAWRRVIAYILMAAFIICTTVGAAMLLPAAGWITVGVTSALVGYLLGAD